MDKKVYTGVAQKNRLIKDVFTDPARQPSHPR